MRGNRGTRWHKRPLSLTLSLSRWERGFALEQQRPAVLPPTRGGRTPSLAQRERAGVREKGIIPTRFPLRVRNWLSGVPNKLARNFIWQCLMAKFQRLKPNR